MEHEKIVEDKEIKKLNAEWAIYKEKSRLERETAKVTDTLPDAKLNKDTQLMEPASSNQ